MKRSVCWALGLLLSAGCYPSTVVYTSGDAQPSEGAAGDSAMDAVDDVDDAGAMDAAPEADAAASSEGGEASVPDGGDGGGDGGDGGPCTPGTTRSCYAGPMGTDGVGACTRGMQFCLVGGMYTACMGMGTPSAEVCDNVDNNCNGTVDEGLTVSCYADNDGDTYAAMGAMRQQRCPVMGRDSVGGCPAGFTNRMPDPMMPRTIDCDDANASRSPGLPELCDMAMLDEDCDGTANPSSLCTCNAGDMRACPLPGVCATGMQTCSATGWGSCSVSPMVEACNGMDDDCNGMVDDNLGTTSCGNGVCRRTVQNCSMGATQACTPDNTRRTAELCDMLDNDCDGVVDNGVRVACYTDMDGDTYAPAGATPSQQCITMGRDTVGGCPAGYTNRAPAGTATTDCNDGNPMINPAAPEVCDTGMTDENCNGAANEGCSCSNGATQPCMQPGRCATGMQTCSGGMWGMCSVMPTAETCNGVDDDCNGMVDEGLGTTTCGQGACVRTVQNCSMGAMQTCTPDSTRMGPETCDNIDNDCNGMVDDGAAAGSCAAVLNATRTCTAGVCGFSACNTGFADCDGNPANGCEANLQTDPLHCGSCATRCGAAGSCRSGACDGVRQLAAGQAFACALRDGGQLACWGSNTVGELGPATTNTGSPTPVALLTATGGAPLGAVGAIALGAQFGCAVLADTTVRCWGSNSFGQLGSGTGGTGSLSRAPVTVQLNSGGNLANVAQLGLGRDFACARTNPVGTTVPARVYCWGHNNNGQLGQGNNNDQNAAVVTVSTGSTAAGFTINSITGLLVGQAHACVLGSITRVSTYNGALCWGLGTSGQLGSGNSNTSQTPVPVQTDLLGAILNGVSGVPTQSPMSNTSGLLTMDGAVHTFGQGQQGQLGNGGMSNANTAAPTVTGLASPQAYSLGQYHACALPSGGGVSCWGTSNLGQLGGATAGSTCSIASLSFPCSTTPSPVPAFVSTRGLTQLVAGQDFSCVHVGTGVSVQCWGSNSNGQLGVSPTSMFTSATPLVISGL